MSPADKIFDPEGDGRLDRQLEQDASDPNRVRSKTAASRPIQRSKRFRSGRRVKGRDGLQRRRNKRINW